MSQIFRERVHWCESIEPAIRDRMDEFNALNQDEKKRLFEGEFANTNYCGPETFDNATWTRTKVK